MKCKKSFFVFLSILFYGCVYAVAVPIIVDNKTKKPIYAAVYCAPRFFGSEVIRDYDLVKIEAHEKGEVLRPPVSLACTRYLTFSDQESLLKKKLTKTQFNSLSSIGVGMTTFGKLFNYFYVREEHGKLQGRTSLGLLYSSEIKTLLDIYAPQVEYWKKHSLLIKDNPYKDKKAQVRIGTELCPDEVRYVEKRKPVVKRALEKLLGKKLNGSYVPTIACLNSGGGVRGMITALGFHIGMQNEGLLDAIMYDLGVSGGAIITALWVQSKKLPSVFSQEFREAVKSGFGFMLNLSPEEKDLITSAVMSRYAVHQPVTLANLAGALIATIYLKQYGKGRQSVLPSQIVSHSDAEHFPFPIFTAANGDHYDQYLNDRLRMNWYEFTPYEVGGVGDWLGNVFIPTWAFGRAFKNGESIDTNPEYDLGLCLAMWGSLFTLSFARFYQDILKGIMGKVFNILEYILPISFFSQYKKSRFSVVKVHNFTQDIMNSQYKDNNTLLLVDAGMSIIYPYTPVSGKNMRKADILIFFEVSSFKVEETGALQLYEAEKYARINGLKFPKLPQGKEFIDSTKKAFTIFKDEKDPEVPVVIYISRIVDRESIRYDASIPDNFSTLVSMFAFAYDNTQFDRLSLVAQQNLEQSIDQIKEALEWKIKQKGGF